MSPDRRADRELDRLLRQAADHPAELSLAEATDRFLHPQPLPWLSRPWYLNPYLMFTSLVLLFGFSLMPIASPPVALTSFPLSVTPLCLGDAVAPLRSPNYMVSYGRTPPDLKMVVTSPLLPLPVAHQPNRQSVYSGQPDNPDVIAPLASDPISQLPDAIDAKPVSFSAAVAVSPTDTLQIGALRQLIAKGRFQIAFDQQLPADIIVLYVPPGANYETRIVRNRILLDKPCGGETIDVVIGGRVNVWDLMFRRCARFAGER